MRNPYVAVFHQHLTSHWSLSFLRVIVFFRLPRPRLYLASLQVYIEQILEFSNAGAPSQADSGLVASPSIGKGQFNTNIAISDMRRPTSNQTEWRRIPELITVKARSRLYCFWNLRGMQKQNGQAQVTFSSTILFHVSRGTEDVDRFRLLCVTEKKSIHLKYRTPTIITYTCFSPRPHGPSHLL